MHRRRGGKERRKGGKNEEEKRWRRRRKAAGPFLEEGKEGSRFAAALPCSSPRRSPERIRDSFEKSSKDDEERKKTTEKRQKTLSHQRHPGLPLLPQPRSLNPAVAVADFFSLSFDPHGVNVAGAIKPVVVPREARVEFRVGADSSKETVERLGKSDGGGVVGVFVVVLLVS